MKTVKRIACLALAIILAFCLCSNAFAADPRASAYLSSYLAYCYPEADGSISVWFEVYGTGIEEVLGVLTIIVEERAPGSTQWKHVKTYMHENHSYLLSYNDDFHYGHVDCADTIPGYSYRAIVTIWGGGMEVGDARYYTTAAVTALTPSNSPNDHPRSNHFILIRPGIFR